MTQRQAVLLMERSIIPYKVIVLEISDQVTIGRAAVDRNSPNRFVVILDVVLYVA